MLIETWFVIDSSESTVRHRPRSGTVVAGWMVSMLTCSSGAFADIEPNQINSVLPSFSCIQQEKPSVNKADAFLQLSLSLIYIGN